MVKFNEIILCTIVLFITITINDVLSLKCWTCSSETQGHEKWCHKFLDHKKIPIEISNANSAFRECNNTLPPGHETMRAVCRKDVNEVEGKVIYHRYCHFIDHREPLDSCSKQTTRENAKKLYCSDCLTDKCNEGTDILPIFTFVLAPTLMAKILTM